VLSDPLGNLLCTICFPRCPGQSSQYSSVNLTQLQFWNITKISDALASDFDFWKNRVFAEELADRYWDAKVVEVWQEDFEWNRWYHAGNTVSISVCCSRPMILSSLIASEAGPNPI
jgi:hypothetical protein